MIHKTCLVVVALLGMVASSGCQTAGGGCPGGSCSSGGGYAPSDSSAGEYVQPTPADGYAAPQGSGGRVFSPAGGGFGGSGSR